MSELTAFFDDGFLLPNQPGSITGLCLLALKKSLLAYFSSYQSEKTNYESYFNYSSYDIEKEDTDRLYQITYAENYVDAVINYQLFIELFVKDILRNEDFDGKINWQKKNENKGLEKHLHKLCDLTSNKKISNFEIYTFVVNYKNEILGINRLRNRLMHRGIYVLRFSSLDQIFGRFALPFLGDFSKLPAYTELERYWKYGQLSCEIDPILALEQEFYRAKGDEYNYRKIALLKELGRSAYHLPISRPLPNLRNLGRRIKGYFPPLVYVDKKEEAAIWARKDAREPSDLLKCPVCGEQTLVKYFELEPVLDYEDEPQNEYVYCVSCHYCSFEIYNNIGDPGEFGLPLENYWN